MLATSSTQSKNIAKARKARDDIVAAVSEEIVFLHCWGSTMCSYLLIYNLELGGFRRKIAKKTCMLYPKVPFLHSAIP